MNLKKEKVQNIIIVLLLVSIISFFTIDFINNKSAI